MAENNHWLRSENAREEVEGRGFNSRHLHDDFRPLTWTFVQVSLRQDTIRTRVVSRISGSGRTSRRPVVSLKKMPLTFGGRITSWAALSHKRPHANQVRGRSWPGQAGR